MLTTCCSKGSTPMLANASSSIDSSGAYALSIRSVIS